MLGDTVPAREATVSIREESQGDASAVRGVHEQAFGGPYEPRLVDMLRNANRVTLSLVAVAAGQVVGHVLFSPVTVEPPSGNLRWAAPDPRLAVTGSPAST